MLICLGPIILGDHVVSVSDNELFFFLSENCIFCWTNNTNICLQFCLILTKTCLATNCNVPVIINVTQLPFTICTTRTHCYFIAGTVPRLSLSACPFDLLCSLQLEPWAPAGDDTEREASNTVRLWPSGVVPYELDLSTGEHRTKLEVCDCGLWCANSVGLIT